ncbi:hypothetical protein SAMN05444920_11835 [Nonomuraea solani]|uniref:Uncharacterized protein n=1 Tax=Nonomuraea solani TaxID=1144553 RepID=A0A1H6EUY3_9ACTN|nr:hypothetical protein [Nonomuraea solani]SEH00846.1 hypothetical protein SAMN05444920_11835 [Nonomuraea solani]
MEVALKILLGLYILQALIKFVSLFAVPYPTRIKRIAAVHAGGGFLRWFDDILLVLMIVLVALLAAVGLEHLSFTTGLLVGLTLTQVFFHRFIRPLAPGRVPPPPLTPIKTMSYAIQAHPRLAGRDILLQAALLIWALFMLIAQP